MEYKGRSQNLRVIAEQLGVANILEGTVRRANGRVRITTQLIDAVTDEHLWAEIYDRDLADIFDVQSDVAQQVAMALKATLTPAEKGRIADKPTENLEAYDHYLLGMEYYGRPGNELDDLRNAQMMFERAVELDPRFALAYARLSGLHASFYWFALDRSEERAKLSLQAVERALQIDPDLPDGHLALGRYYYQVHRDYDRALEEFAVAERGLPGEATLLYWRGLIWRRQGKWDEALASLERAAALDPRSLDVLNNLAHTYTRLRR
jgi:tetratricopeptide (TPR) repeat protein